LTKEVQILDIPERRKEVKSDARDKAGDVFGTWDVD